MHDMTDREAVSCAILDQHPWGIGAPARQGDSLNDTLPYEEAALQ